jgi:NADH kinase
VSKVHPEVHIYGEKKPESLAGVQAWSPGPFPSVNPVLACTSPDISKIYHYAGVGAEKIDLIVTFGGDGTILHASSLFSAGAVPPVLSFSMGTLGFLLPFRMSFISSCPFPLF